jgi:uncharacterized protein YbjT (DUF2867 family)
LTRNKQDLEEKMQERPILVTGAAGRVGAIGRTLTQLLIARGHAVRAMVRREDDRSRALQEMGAELVVGDLRDLHTMHRAIDGCKSVYFGMSVSDAYLEATINAAAVAKHYGVDAFVNMSQMTLSQMSINETTESPQHKLHWLAEQALNWSGLPVVHVRPTVFLEGFFLQLASAAVRESNELRLPFGDGKTAPVSANDVADVLVAILDNPAPHVGQTYHLTGPESQDMHFYAQEYTKALGRPITYVDIPLEGWRAALIEKGFPMHVVNHLSAMADLHRAGRYDRQSDDVLKLAGRPATSVHDFVQRNEKAFRPRAAG